MNNPCKINPKSIHGAVRDLQSGRICAIPTDIARPLGLASCQIASIPARRYGRYVDVLDCLEFRAGMRKATRPWARCRETKTAI